MGCYFTGGDNTDSETIIGQDWDWQYDGLWFDDAIDDAVPFLDTSQMPENLVLVPCVGRYEKALDLLDAAAELGVMSSRKLPCLRF